MKNNKGSENDNGGRNGKNRRNGNGNGNGEGSQQQDKLADENVAKIVNPKFPRTVFKTGLRLMSGNEAIAEAALYAGCRFFAGYPITPSSEIAEHLAKRLPQVGGYFVQMEDEIAAMGAILGASLAGAKVLTATSGPGFSLKQENIGYGCIAEIPCVIVNVMRGGPSTGVPTKASQGDVMQARWGTHGDHPIVVLTPDSVEELFWETVRAFRIAERFRTPVIILADEIIGHMRERLFLPKPATVNVQGRRRPRRDTGEYSAYQIPRSDIPIIPNFGEGYRYHVTGLAHDETGFPTSEPAVIENELIRLHRKINRASNVIVKWEQYFLDDADVAVVAYGSSARSARAAVNRLRASGRKTGMFRLKTMWPFPTRAIKALSERVKAIIVPELNMGQAVLQVERAALQKCKIIRLNRVDSEMISPKQIVKIVKDL